MPLLMLLVFFMRRRISEFCLIIIITVSCVLRSRSVYLRGSRFVGFAVEGSSPLNYVALPAALIVELFIALFCRI